MTKLFILILVIVKIVVFSSSQESMIGTGLILWLILVLIFAKANPFLGLIASASPFLHHLSSSRPEFIIPPILLGLSFNSTNKKVFILGLVLATTSLFYLTSPLIREWNLITHLRPENLYQSSQLSQNQDYLASGRTFIYPSILRHTLFSWPIQAIDQLFKQVYSILDITLWTAPSAGYTLLKNWGISPNNLYPLLFFFDPILIFFALLKTTKFAKITILLSAGLIPAILVQPKWVPLSGVLLVSAFWYIQSGLKNKLITLIIFLAGLKHLLIPS